MDKILFTDTQKYKQRVKELIPVLGLSRRVMSQRLGVSTSYVSKLINNMNADASLSGMYKILSTFPEIDELWLAFGYGSMLKIGNNNNEQDDNYYMRLYHAKQRECDKLSQQIEDWRDAFLKNMKSIQDLSAENATLRAELDKIKLDA